MLVKKKKRLVCSYYHCFLEFYLSSVYCLSFWKNVRLNCLLKHEYNEPLSLLSLFLPVHLKQSTYDWVTNLTSLVWFLFFSSKKTDCKKKKKSLMSVLQGLDRCWKSRMLKQLWSPVFCYCWDSMLCLANSWIKEEVRFSLVYIKQWDCMMFHHPWC